MHCWTDLQSVHGFRCYDNRAPNAKCQRVLVLALCLVILVTIGRAGKDYGNETKFSGRDENGN